MEKNQVPTQETKETMEAPETTIERLKQELEQVSQIANNYAKENQILRAVVKGLSSML